MPLRAAHHPYASRARAGARLLRWIALPAVLLAALLGSVAAEASPSLPAMGVPLTTLLRDEPGLANGLALAGVVHRAGTASTTAPPLAATARDVGSIVQVRRGEQVLVHRTPGGGIVESFDDRSDTVSRRAAGSACRCRRCGDGWAGSMRTRSR
jgi:hypothetical protein